eukprot:13194053-Alexandrium_andersonii.AAC.1
MPDESSWPILSSRPLVLCMLELLPSCPRSEACLGRPSAERPLLAPVPAHLSECMAPAGCILPRPNAAPPPLGQP